MRRIQRRNNGKSTSFIILIGLLILFGLQTIIEDKVAFSPVLVIGIVSFILTFFIFLLFFSFFVIPINEPAELFLIFNRIILFIFKRHGPIIQIIEGKKKEIHAGFIKGNPGLVYLDSASAVIVSRTSTYHRTAGPGIVFTEKGEQILNSVDLRFRKECIGPIENENPFLPQQKNEPFEKYQSRMLRAEETIALSADGKKIIASFSLIIKLRAKPGEGGSPYGFDPLSINKALLSQPFVTGINPQKTIIKWSDIPGVLVADIWRELIGHYKFDDIFSTEKSVLIDCIRAIQERICSSEYLKEKDDGLTTNNHNQSEEYRFLYERGIEVNEIHLMNLHILENDEKEMLLKQNNIQKAIADDESKKTSTDDVRLEGKMSGNALAANLMAGIINKMAIKNNLQTETLTEMVLQKLRSID